MRWINFCFAAATSIVLSACANSGFLPEGGPNKYAASTTASLELGSQELQAKVPFVLVSPTIELANSLSGEPDRVGSLPRRSLPEIRARVGDLVLVTIFEAGSGGLFTTPQAAGNSGGGGNFVNLPAQAVDVQGRISVPYAGSVRIAGRSLTDAQAEIEGKLRQRAIEPQVVITIQEERASMVTVLGTVKQGGRFPVRNTQMRVLDAIARAGGIESPRAGVEGTSTRSYEVVLQRGGHTARASMRRLLLDPQANATVLPGDTIFVQPVSRAVNVFGATGESLRIGIEIDNMTLTDVLGRSKGFNDTRSDVGSVFVLRMEHRRSLPASAENLEKFQGVTVPTVYQVRYDLPAGIFVGNHFKVRHGDVIYVSNATGVQLRKLLELIGLVTRPTREIVGGVLVTP